MQRVRFIGLIAVVTLLIVGCSSHPRFRDEPVSKRYKDRPAKLKKGQTWRGVASYYGPKFHGRKTSNGEVFDMHRFTAAHKTLPFGTILEVTNLKNGKKCQVRINDRGPFIEGRIIDLSMGSAKKIGMINDGIAEVELKIIKVGGR